MLVAGMVSMLLLNITAAWQFYHRGKVITEVDGVGVAGVLQCLRDCQLYEGAEECNHQRTLPFIKMDFVSIQFFSDVPIHCGDGTISLSLVALQIRAYPYFRSRQHLSSLLPVYW